MENHIKEILNSQTEENNFFDVDTLITLEIKAEYIEINGVKFIIFQDGDVFRNMIYHKGHNDFFSRPHWKQVKNNINVRILDKMTTFPGLIAHVWLSHFSIYDKDKIIIHIDGNKSNNHANNLKVMPRKKSIL